MSEILNSNLFRTISERFAIEKLNERDCFLLLIRFIFIFVLFLLVKFDLLTGIRPIILAIYESLIRL